MNVVKFERDRRPIIKTYTIVLQSTNDMYYLKLNCLSYI